MDEIQTLPCKLWDPIDHLLRELTDMGNCRILAMSATLPGFLSGALELVPDYTWYFKRFGRYRLVLKHAETISLKEFADNVVQRLSKWQQEKRRVLITLNTRKSARTVRDALEDAGATPLYFLSADVTPGDRLKMISEIKQNNPCIVVSTQCIEAGVDIDLDLVIRDFAPLDSIIQVAGRCNRNALKDRCDVELFSITNDKQRRFSDLIYDQIHLNETCRALEGFSEILEEEVIEVCNRYFEGLAAKKDTGKAITKAYARWEEMPSVQELLRGKENLQYRFIVIEQDPELKGEMEEALAISERWERRRALRNLVGRIARISVSVYANGKFNQADIAQPIGSEWLLDEGLYEYGRGLVLPDFMGGGTMIL
jgi:CRISPR-associated endonuclease/helicase Cas3